MRLKTRRASSRQRFINPAGISLLELTISIPVVLGFCLSAVNVSHYIRARAAALEGARSALKCLIPTDGECHPTASHSPETKYYDVWDQLDTPGRNVSLKIYDGTLNRVSVRNSSATLSQFRARVLKQLFTPAKTYRATNNLNARSVSYVRDMPSIRFNDPKNQEVGFQIFGYDASGHETRWQNVKSIHPAQALVRGGRKTLSVPITISSHDLHVPLELQQSPSPTNCFAGDQGEATRIPCDTSSSWGFSSLSKKAESLSLSQQFHQSTYAVVWVKGAVIGESERSSQVTMDLHTSETRSLGGQVIQTEGGNSKIRNFIPRGAPLSHYLNIGDTPSQSPHYREPELHQALLVPINQEFHLQFAIPETALSYKIQEIRIYLPQYTKQVHLTPKEESSIKEFACVRSRQEVEDLLSHDPALVGFAIFDEETCSDSAYITPCPENMGVSTESLSIPNDPNFRHSTFIASEEADSLCPLSPLATLTHSFPQELPSGGLWEEKEIPLSHSPVILPPKNCEDACQAAQSYRDEELSARYQKVVFHCDKGSLEEVPLNSHVSYTDILAERTTQYLGCSVSATTQLLSKTLGVPHHNLLGKPIPDIGCYEQILNAEIQDEYPAPSNISFEAVEINKTMPLDKAYSLLSTLHVPLHFTPRGQPILDSCTNWKFDHGDASKKILLASHVPENQVTSACTNAQGVCSTSYSGGRKESSGDQREGDIHLAHAKAEETLERLLPVGWTQHPSYAPRVDPILHTVDPSGRNAYEVTIQVPVPLFPFGDKIAVPVSYSQKEITEASYALPP